MKQKRKPILIALLCVAAVLLIAAGLWFFWLKDTLSAAGSPPVYVTQVSTILGLDTGSSPRYSGIVEPQQTYKINKDETKTVAEVLVSTGDEVHIGDVLFRYDTEDLQMSLREAELAQEGIANQISTLKAQLSTLKAEKAKASKDDQYSYTVEIQGVELQIEQQEYESSVKKGDIDKLKKDLENTDVISEVEGVVKEVNTVPKMDSSGQQAPFISILSSGEYRVKGTVSELNQGSLAVEQKVIVHSRIDPDQQWSGTVESIDQEPASDQNTGGFYYPGMDSGEKSSKYNFYVVLDNLDGLILGQHVYIEPDLGEGAKREGLWLPAVYVDHDESGSFVWAKNDKDKLEKRLITLGEYDNENDRYEIKSGMTRADSIAYPSDTLKPGMPTTTDASLQTTMPDGMNGGSVLGGMDGMGGVPSGADNAMLPVEDGMIDPGMEDYGDGTVPEEGYDDAVPAGEEDYPADTGEGVVE